MPPELERELDESTEQAIDDWIEQRHEYTEMIEALNQKENLLDSFQREN